MSKLTDLELRSIYSKAFSEKSSEGIVTAGVAALRAIEAAATEPLLQRIAELEQNNRDLSDDVQRFRKHAMNEKAARLELERQLEEARNQALEEAAVECDKRAHAGDAGALMAARAIRAIRALNGAKK